MPSRGAILVRCLLLPLLGALLLLVPPAYAAPTPAGTYPQLPIGLDREFLGNLSAPTLAPGGSGSISFTVADPLPGALSAVVLTLGLYAFNGFPGNMTGGLPVAGPPVLTTSTTSGTSANVSIGTLGPKEVIAGSVGIATSDTTPSGTFAVRTALAFSENGTDYLLESRGWFAPSLWANSTELSNGSVTVNLTRLGVSGVLPETAVLVSSSDLEWALAAIAAAGIVLVAAGAWVYFRRESKSSGGAR